MKVPVPNLRTPDEDLNKVEQYKLGSYGMRGRLHDHFLDLSMDEIIDGPNGNLKQMVRHLMEPTCSSSAAPKTPDTRASR